MATELSHIALANKNHHTLQFLMEREVEHPEWITTIAFYKALQVVEAVFCNELKRNAHTHKRRLEMLKQPKFKAIFPHYRTLWSASTIARYLHDHESQQGYQAFSDYCPPGDVIKRFVNKRLRAIEQNAVSMLSKNALALLQRIPETEPAALSRETDS